MGDRRQSGIHLTYKEQPSPDGLAQVFVIGEELIEDDCVVMILGDKERLFLAFIWMTLNDLIL